MKLGGAALCGRYGGGGSAKLLLSANGSAGLCEFDVIDTISEVSIPPWWEKVKRMAAVKSPMNVPQAERQGLMVPDA
ncbi:predicted protein [Pyrenophora tritici-repentis Pt-1C-BFP]|uniref:Uncharacterized protein n=1 Tax=Pyrenophora tritici-repentis (strain Pt-1C-BFP) TaxID=426418 RepID=B2WJI7_PYRTR|nr:uncharacterized protein PTRG_10333 [Pyrenophora tritici-repentis Pt-1C-BFP]EDU43384.1 predicted protein [Pyrenophora tritici-repentis Pt-1C-BFP]